MDGAFSEIFEYNFTRLDPVAGDHIDPPSVAIYETLLTKGPDGLPRPGLAEDWVISEDGLSWRLRLRKGATFHSGRVCDAAAVLEALELGRWGDGLTRQIWYWDPVDSVHAVADDVVEFQLLYPCVRLPALLWGWHTAILNASTRSQLGSDFGVSVADGTGPYRLSSFSPEQVEAEAFDSHPAHGQGTAPRRIRWRAIPDAESRASCLSDDDVHAIRALDPTDVHRLPANWRLDQRAEVSQIYLALNFDDPRGFGDPRFRRAVDGLVDRAELVRVALGGHGEGRRSPIPSSDEYGSVWEPADEAGLDRMTAARSLADLGFVPGAEGVLERDGLALTIDCLVQDCEQIRAVAEVLRNQLGSAGIRLSLRYEPPFEPFYRAAAASPASFVSKWLWSDAMEAVMGFAREDCMAPGGGNWQRARTPSVDGAFDSFLQATSNSALNEASRDVQRVFMSELPFIPLCSTVETLAVRANVAGFGLPQSALYPSYDLVRLPLEG